MFFKAVVNNKLVQLNLCEKCAKERGLELSFGKPPFSITDLISGLSALSGQGSPIKPAILKCPSCGLRYSSFKETGFLGCRKCYGSFAPILDDILKRVQGSVQHHGKPYTFVSSDTRAGSKAADLSQLKRDLAAAIKKEDFEKAAAIRDQIHQMERS